MTQKEPTPTVEMHLHPGNVLFVPKGLKEKLSSSPTMQSFKREASDAISEQALTATGKAVLKAVRELGSHVRKITIGPLSLKLHFGLSGNRDGNQRYEDARKKIFNAIQDAHGTYAEASVNSSVLSAAISV